MQVRSCTLDTWLPEQVTFMDRTGNAKANAHYEAKLDPAQKPSYYSPDLEAFIRRKVPLLLLLTMPCKWTTRTLPEDDVFSSRPENKEPQPMCG